MRRILLMSVSPEALHYYTPALRLPRCLILSQEAVYVRRLTTLERLNNRTCEEVVLHTHGVFFGEDAVPLIHTTTYAAAVREAKGLTSVVYTVH